MIKIAVVGRECIILLKDVCQNKLYGLIYELAGHFTNKYVNYADPNYRSRMRVEFILADSFQQL